MTKFLIYALLDPRSLEWRYVGRSCSGLKRPRSHWMPCHLKEDNYKARWLRKLVEEGLEPVIEILESFEGPEKLNEAEQEWIAEARRVGCRLTNSTDGGDGIVGHRHRPETKLKMSRSQAGKKVSEETKRKLAEISRHQDKSALQAAREAYWTPEARQAHRLFMKEFNKAPEAREKLRENGRRAHEVAHDKCMAAMRTPEARANHRLAQKNRFSTPESRARASIAHGGRPVFDSQGRQFQTLTEASKITGVPRANISAVLRGARRIAKGLVFSREPPTP